jgi:hypothetical protein
VEEANKNQISLTKPAPKTQACRVSEVAWFATIARKRLFPRKFCQQPIAPFGDDRLRRCAEPDAQSEGCFDSFKMPRPCARKITFISLDAADNEPIIPSAAPTSSAKSNSRERFGISGGCGKPLSTGVGHPS